MTNVPNADLNPPPFSDGLVVWSSQNGVPGSATYANSNNAQVLFTDPDFDECLEIVTNKSPQKLRYTGQTLIPPGCYLRVSARVKVVSGIMPDFEIAAFPGDIGGNYVGGVVEKGPAVAATQYDQVYEISAVFGSGDRPGVDCVWGLVPVYGHFGLNVVGGQNGSSVRIESIRIEDVTTEYLRVMMDWVDVRDFGARGDGIFNNKAAFLAADAAANGRQVLVPSGDYFISSNIDLNSEFRFEGRIIQAEDDRFNLRDGLRFGAYRDAFKNDELAFKKAMHTLFRTDEHDSLDLEGRKVVLTQPVDLRAVIGANSSNARRVVRNGKLEAATNGNWSVSIKTRAANYAAGTSQLTGVADAGGVAVGSLVTGAGVGREVYVRSVDAASGVITLSNPLYAAAANQTYTFTRYAYMLDFTGFGFVSNFEIAGVEFEGNEVASLITLPPDGFNWRIYDCWFRRPRDRGISSCGNGDFAMTIEHCEFLTDDFQVPNASRQKVGFNSNGNDVRIRHCRAAWFRHFCILGGTNIMFHANHVYQGSTTVTTPLGGVVFTEGTINSTVTGNYIDNCRIEWTNEHSNSTGQFPAFGSLTIDGNLFFAADVTSNHRFIFIFPHFGNAALRDFTVTDNTFRVTGTTIPRVEDFSATIGSLNKNNFRNVTFAGNGYEGVSVPTQNPLRVEHNQGAASDLWAIPAGGRFPFVGLAKGFDAWAATAATFGAGGFVDIAPYVAGLSGNGDDILRLRWLQPVTGACTVTFRCDQLEV